MSTLNLHRINKYRIKNFFIGATLLGWFASLPANALMVITDIVGEVTASTTDGAISSSLAVGYLFDAKRTWKLLGSGRITVFCVDDGTSLSLKAPQEIKTSCLRKVTASEQYRGEDDNGAPLLFFPKAGDTNFLKEIVWGSTTKGRFQITLLSQSSNGAMIEFFKSDTLAITTAQNRFITYSYRLPQNILDSLKPGTSYLIKISNTRNGRSTEESSMPGGFIHWKPSQAKGEHQSSRSLKNIKDQPTNILAQAAYMADNKSLYPAFSKLNELPDNGLAAQAAYIRGRILQQAAAPFDYYTSMYRYAFDLSLKNNLQPIMAVIACQALQEDLFNIQGYWEQQLKSMKQSRRYQPYCQL